MILMTKMETKYSIDIKGDRLDLQLKDTSFPYDGKGYKDRLIARAVILDYDKFVFAHIDRDDRFGRLSFIETSGGGVEEGESLEEGLKRELREEMGMEVDIISYLGQVTDYYNLINRRNLNHYYLVRKIKDVPNHLMKDEIDQFHLRKVSLTYQDAIDIYDKIKDDKLGKLIVNREKPVVDLAKKIADSYGLY